MKFIVQINESRLLNRVTYSEPCVQQMQAWNLLKRSVPTFASASPYVINIIGHSAGRQGFVIWSNLFDRLKTLAQLSQLRRANCAIRFRHFGSRRSRRRRRRGAVADSEVARAEISGINSYHRKNSHFQDYSQARDTGDGSATYEIVAAHMVNLE